MSNMSMSVSRLQPMVAPYGKLRSSTSLAFVVLAAIVSTTVFIYPFGESWTSANTYDDPLGARHLEDGARYGSLARQIPLGALGLFGLAALAVPGGKPLRIRNLLGVLCVAYLVWCAMSVLWADSLETSIRRWVAFMCEVAAGIAIAKRVTARQFVWIVFVATLTWLLFGVVAELSLGTFRPWVAGNRFAGVFHPNVMGVSIATLVIASLYLAKDVRRGRWLLVLAAAVAFAFLLLTRSRTSVIAMFISLAVLWIYMAPSGKALRYSVMLGAAVAFGAVILNLTGITVSEQTVSLGRNDTELTTLTGRLPLWEELLEDYAPQRPLLGFGYGAFWTDRHIDNVSNSQGWAISHAHSSYIDLILNLGYPGALLCVSAMVAGVIAALRREARHAGDGYGFIAMVVLCGLTAGLTETYVGLTWFLSFFGICGMCFLVLDDPYDANPSSTEPELNQTERYKSTHHASAMA